MKKHAKHIGSKSMPQGIIQHQESQSVRLNKFISESGYTSRRNADRLIQDGRVRINGVVAEVGTQVLTSDTVQIDETIITKHTQQIYIALNKPVGITSTTNLEDETNIVDFMNHQETLFPIGRLDKDSNGLILLTNDGDIVNKILRAEYGHDKEYIVRVHKNYDADFITKMSQGVSIYNQKKHQMQTTQACVVEAIDARTFKIILNQGLNRQIRRMTKALGYRVTDLRRIRIMGINLDPLKSGEWRYLSEEELIDLNQRITE